MKYLRIWTQALDFMTLLQSSLYSTEIKHKELFLFLMYLNALRLFFNSAPEMCELLIRNSVFLGSKFATPSHS